jgi:hypothetical protein
VRHGPWACIYLLCSYEDAKRECFVRAEELEALYSGTPYTDED